MVECYNDFLNMQRKEKTPLRCLSSAEKSNYLIMIAVKFSIMKNLTRAFWSVLRGSKVLLHGVTSDYKM